MKINTKAVLLALLFGAALPKTQAATIPFPTQAGEWLAQVTAVINPGNGATTQYVGYSNNYGTIPIGNTNQGPSVPNTFLPTQGFVDTSLGTLGVTGEAPGGLGSNYFTRAEAAFAIAVQFNIAGTVSFAMREQGFVAVNGTSAFDHAEMQTSVAIVDNTGRGASSVGTLLCVSAPVVLCSTPPSVDQVFTATLDVVPGHVYTLSAAEWGDANDFGVFDGLDPVTMSLQLDPGMSIVPVNGITLPGFLGGPGPGPASGSAPEPATWALTGCAAAVLAGHRLRQLRRLCASPATGRSIEPGDGV